MIEISTELIILCLASFTAGFVDSIVGGGGLIQLPALMLLLPTQPVVTLLATNKIISVTGTAFSTWRFSRSVPYLPTIFLPAMLSAFVASWLGAYTVTLLSSETLRPIFMLLMFVVFLTTIRNKDWGMLDHDPNVVIPLWKPLSIGAVIGFYDGFFGPGTGSFLIIAFVGMMNMTFVQGSAYAKIINLTTNIAAIFLFIWKADFLWAYAIPMMLFNVGGALVGVKMALLKGNKFVRGLLRGIVFATILKLAFDIYQDYL